MIFANIREVKSKISELLRKTDKGEDVFITYRGKPRAVLHRISQDDIEDYILLNHPKFKEKIEKACKEALEGKVTDLNDLITETEKELGRI